MSRIKHAIDPPFLKHWATRIGQLILNFTVLEFESYFWLVQMSEQPDRIPEFTRLTYASRVKEIKRLVRRLAHSSEWENEALAKWNESLDIAKLRNRITHNPLLFSWTSGIEKGEPDLIGIADMKSRRPVESSDGPLLPKAVITESINKAVNIATGLATLRNVWCEYQDK